MAAGVFGDASGGASQDEPTEQATAMGSKHDGVRLLCLGSRNDRLRRVAFPNKERRTCAGRSSSRDQHLCLGLHPGSFLVDTPEEPTARQSESPRIDDGHDDELGAMF